MLGDGSEIGVNINYKIQLEPKGIAEALLIGKEFIANDAVSLILGDNIFYGSEISSKEIDPKFKLASQNKDGAYVIAYQVADPERYGVVELNKDNLALSIEEKPVSQNLILRLRVGIFMIIRLLILPKISSLLYAEN